MPICLLTSFFLSFASHTHRFLWLYSIHMENGYPKRGGRKELGWLSTPRQFICSFFFFLSCSVEENWISTERSDLTFILSSFSPLLPKYFGASLRSSWLLLNFNWVCGSMLKVGLIFYNPAVVSGGQAAVKRLFALQSLPTYRALQLIPFSFLRRNQVKTVEYHQQECAAPSHHLPSFATFAVKGEQSAASRACGTGAHWR